MKKILLPLILISLFFGFTSCDDDNDSLVINSPIDLFEDLYDNIPVIVNTEDSFTFTVVANDFDYTYDNNVNFTTDSLIVTVTLNNASGINSSLKLLDDNGNSFFTESLNQSKVSVNTEIFNSSFESIKINLEDFSGQLTLVVALKNP